MIGRHHPAERAECHAVTREPGRRKLVIGGLADIGEPIGGFDHLSRPSVRDLDPRHERARGPHEPVVASGRILGLAGLVILAAIDHQIVIAPRLDAE